MSLRKAHLRIAQSALQDMRQKLQENQMEHQIYMTIALEDAAQDTLHVHTQNPVGTPLPLERIQSLPLSTDVPEWITELFSTHAYTFRQTEETFTDYTEDEPVTSIVTLYHIFPNT